MAYRSGYKSGYRRSFTAGPVQKVNQRPGDCRTCGEEIPAGAGQLYRESSAWSVQHWPASKSGPASMWDRAPITGGCPDATDRENARMLAAGFIDALPVPERDRIASAAAAFTPAERPVRQQREFYGYSSNGRRKCEDAPCCGCCD